ncbi:MAG: hypothetical protein IPH12_16200 [Saprospirales bacterium]|nr:hypothetical protein [Saprospirales bacterium]
MLSGQQGPAGQPDIRALTKASTPFSAKYWIAQELPTDEAVIAWNDGTIQDFHQQDWDANSEFITAMYSRIFYQISTCNEYIRETTDAKLNSRGVDAALNAGHREVPGRSPVRPRPGLLARAGSVPQRPLCHGCR